MIHASILNNKGGDEMHDLSYNSLREAAIGLPINHNYLKGTVKGAVIRLLRAAAEGFKHAEELGGNVIDDQHVHRLALMMWEVHCALNHLVKHADEFPQATKETLVRMMDAYHTLRFAVGGNEPGGIDQPAW